MCLVLLKSENKREPRQLNERYVKTSNAYLNLKLITAYLTFFKKLNHLAELWNSNF